MVTKNPFDPKIFLSVVGTGKTVSKYQKGQVIFAQGDVTDAIYYLQKGRVKVVVLSEQGKEAVVGLLEAGQFFRAGDLKRGKLPTATATLLGPGRITPLIKIQVLRRMQKSR